MVHMFDGSQGWHKDTEWGGADLEWDSGDGWGKGIVEQ